MSYQTPYTKLHTIISQLLYPAFLGALIFEFIQRINDVSLAYGNITKELFFVSLIFVHYSIDFIYVYDPKVAKIYN